MMLVSHLSPDLVSHIDLLEPDPDLDPIPDPDTEGPGLDQGLNQICQSVTCQRTITDLQNEKTKAESELQELREELDRTREELLKEKHDNTLLIAEKVRLNKLLNSYNRVSLLALEEFEELQTDLDLEKNLRSEAENFAREMLVEQKKLKRQSQILVQNLGPDQVLIEALDQVQKLTADLERERLQHQEEVREGI
ncbi:hypothetical protein NL108_018069 [Boleophthalmus pectinirostris]|nr:hypothetical protein NL108_018069 [Boleophthalmus pectinirostris]